MEPVKAKKSNSSIIWILLLALSLIGTFLLWKDNKGNVEYYETKMDSLVTARVEIEKELGETYAELNKYKGINSELDSLLVDANAAVDAQQQRIAALIRKERNSNGLNSKLKAEIAELKKLRNEYLERVDQLLVANETLKKENVKLSANVESLTKNLESTVSRASQLRAEYIKVSSYKRRSNGKYVETALSRKTDKLEICFSVLENEITPAGPKNVYLRVIEPGGKTLGARSAGSSSFTPIGSSEEILFTNSTILDYQNTMEDICMVWEDEGSTFIAGTYVTEIYIDGNFGGSGKVVLR
ncbi:MAG: hypothetical protein KJO64_04045 [Bacteroidia bacterium]|nr:hypothetical protein [Bacteroidia bacterium]NNC84679.1 hypothetical protein [Bacteroidia bacterium]